MRPGSLRFRLLVTAALALTVALVVAGMSLAALFEQQFRNRVNRELSNHMRQLVAALDIADNGRVTVRNAALADPRFNQPLSGLYWKVITSNGTTLTSRSLWDTDIAHLSGAPLKAGHERLTEAHAIDGTGLLVLAQRITATRAAGDVVVDLEVAIERREVAAPVSVFVRELAVSLGLLAMFLIAAVWVQVGIGLRPLAILQQRLSAVRAGRAEGLAGSYPEEIAPLVSEVNQLITAQRVSLERARARAGDLAHGLKTPLAILTTLSRDLRRNGHNEAATQIEEQAEVMRLQVERGLVRARLAAGHSRASCVLGPELTHLIDTMKRLPRGADLAWELRCPEGLDFGMDVVDLVELFGNILDNARKWAKARVRIEVSESEGQRVMTVGDDGPGVASADHAAMLERGRRLSEGDEGSGLGLAIAAEVAVAYGFELSLGRSSLGGLEVRVSQRGVKPTPALVSPSSGSERERLVERT